jgi:hypothetical protein
MSICRDGRVTLGGFGFVRGTAVFVLRLDFQRSPERTFFVLCDVEFHHHIAVHRFGVSPCTRPALNVIAVTQGQYLRRRVVVLLSNGVQELCAVRRIIPGTVSCKKFRNGFIDLQGFSKMRPRLRGS